MGKDHRSPDHLVSLFWINAELYGKINSLIEFCPGGFFCKADGLLEAVKLRPINECRCCFEFFSCCHGSSSRSLRLLSASRIRRHYSIFKMENSIVFSIES